MRDAMSEFGPNLDDRHVCLRAAIRGRLDIETTDSISEIPYGALTARA
jgi:hypothetical protein